MGRLRGALVAAAVLLAFCPAPSASANGTTIDTIVVFNNDTTPEQSVKLEYDHDYRLVVSGTASDWGGTYNKGVDALYCYKHIASCTSPPMLWRPLRIQIGPTQPNGIGLDEFLGTSMSYSDQHVYSGDFTKQNARLTFESADAVSGSPSDDTGYFKVQLIDLGKSHWSVNASSQAQAASPTGVVHVSISGSGTFFFKGDPDLDGNKVTKTKPFGFTVTERVTDPILGDITHQLTLVPKDGTGAFNGDDDDRPFDREISLAVKVDTSDIDDCPIGATGKIFLSSSSPVVLNLCNDQWTHRSGYTQGVAVVSMSTPTYIPPT